MPPIGKHWQYTPDKLDELDAADEIYWSPTGNPRRKVFCDLSKGIPIQDIWLNYRDSVNQAQKTTGYPTEKNYEMLNNDCLCFFQSRRHCFRLFCWEWYNMGAAFECGRKWIGADKSLESIRAILKRFTSGLDLYGEYVSTPSECQQMALELEEKCLFSIYTTDELKSELEHLCGIGMELKNVKVGNNKVVFL